jgi:fatty acid synthase subunit alpha
MSAKTALELGAPIRGILAFTSTSTYALVSSVILPSLNPTFSDKAGRSVPAPGKGALTVAREVPSNHPLPILDVAYRSRQLAFRRKQISEWLSHEHSQLHEEQEFRRAQGEPIDQEYFSSRIADIEKEAVRQEKDALAMYGMLEGSDPRVAPLRRALAVWGLTADDIGVLSIHGTSTNANVSYVTFTPNNIL